jgi:tRNA pseudouridine(55) synthase
MLEKPAGQTPLQAIESWKAANPEFAEVPATYAGRLDPMASGKLLVLLGDECRRAAKYTGLDKEYEIEVVFGIGTDTGDALGKPSVGAPGSLSVEDIARVTRAVLGSHTVPYPAFSSKTVNGVPLFQYALDGRLGEIEIPAHTETVHAIRIREFCRITGAELLERIRAHLAHVPRTDDPSRRLGADFRQDEIRAAWEDALAGQAGAPFPLARFAVTCATGTYMRTLAERLGAQLGTSGFALSIRRSKIGRYRKIGPLGFWARTY